MGCWEAFSLVLCTDACERMKTHDCLIPLSWLGVQEGHMARSRDT